MKYALFILLCCRTQILATMFRDKNISIGNILTKIEPKIIGGIPAVMENSKHVVSVRLKILEQIQFGSGHICGGTLISSNIILTAAHCFLNYQARPETIRGEHEFKVVMGTLSRFNKTQNTLVFDVRKIIHKMFRAEDFSNDIGILILKGNVPNNHPTVKAMELITTETSQETACQIFGWGVIQPGTKEGSPTLMTANISLIKNDDCLKIYGEKLKPGMICAGVLEGDIDSCQGDSGGPLICDQKLVGLVSWGEKCGIAGFPGIYTEISYYKSWINKSLTHYQNRINYIKNSNFIISIRKKNLETKEFGSGHFCSGAFYVPSNKSRSNLVVTSADCVYSFNKEEKPHNLLAVFGTPHRHKMNLKTRIYDVTSLRIHPNFNKDFSDFYNIAVLELSGFFTQEEVDGPPINNATALNRSFCYTYAWNTLFEPFYEGDDALQVGNATAYDLKECNKIFDNQLKNGMFCAGHINGLQEEVQTDIGGALVCDEKLTGIMLQRFDTALSGYPSIYTDIGYFKDWLESNRSTRCLLNILSFVNLLLCHALVILL